MRSSLSLHPGLYPILSHQIKVQKTIERPSLQRVGYAQIFQRFRRRRKRRKRRRVIQAASEAEEQLVDLIMDLQTKVQVLEEDRIAKEDVARMTGGAKKNSNKSARKPPKGGSAEFSLGGRR